MDEGYILIHRKIVKEWEWYSNVNDRLVWLHCLLSANWKDGYFEGIKVLRGSFVTGRKKLAKEVGLTEQQVRTSLNHLKSTNNITIKAHNKFSIITINNYNKYQLSNQQINQQSTNNQPTSNHNRIKEIKEINNKEINIKKKYGSFENVKLTDDEYQKLKEKFRDFEDKIENLSSYLAMKGDKYKSHYATILNWAKKDDKGLPSWFNKEPIERKRTEDEERQLQELIRGNRR